MDDKPKPGLVTQFGDLTNRVTEVDGKYDAKHEEIKRTLSAQDREMRDIKTQGRLTIKQVEDQAKEVLLVKQATNRTEAKADKLIEQTAELIKATNNVSAVFRGIVWLGETIKKLWPLWLVCGLVLGWVKLH